MKKVKAFFAYILFGFLKGRKQEVADAKALADKAKELIAEAHKQIELSETKYDENIENVRQAMIKQQEQFENFIRERQELKKIKEQTVKITEPK